MKKTLLTAMLLLSLSVSATDNTDYEGFMKKEYMCYELAKTAGIISNIEHLDKGKHFFGYWWEQRRKNEEHMGSKIADEAFWFGWVVGTTTSVIDSKSNKSGITPKELAGNMYLLSCTE